MYTGSLYLLIHAISCSVRDLREEDSGNYVCLATSQGVFHIEAVSHVEVGEARGK